MANQDRVNFVWAESALTTIPPIPVSEVAYRDTTQTPKQMEVGQQYDTIYNSARHNQLLFLLTSVAKTLCENGIMPFLAGQEYSQYARCIFTDGKLYTASRAILANEQPYPTPGDDSGVWIAEETSENLVPNSRRVIAGTGLTGGGPLSSDVTLSAKLDGKTTQAAADGAITVKDVAIGGNLGDLASARGIFDTLTKGSVDCNTLTEQGVYALSLAGTVNGPGFSAKLIVFNGKNSKFVNQMALAAGVGTSDAIRVAYRTKNNEDVWSSWSEGILSGRIGDGLTVSNGIISVPEYEGATASTAGISGLVPPATAGQQESFLTGGGVYKSALTKISDAINSTDSTVASSSKAVKSAYDRGSEGISKATAAQNSAANALAVANTKQPNLGFTPIQQGGGTGQGTNKVYIGWATDASGLKAQADRTNLGNIVTTAGGTTKAPQAALADRAKVANTSETLSVTGWGNTKWGSTPYGQSPLYVWCLPRGGSDMMPCSPGVLSAGAANFCTYTPNVRVGTNGSVLPAGGTWRCIISRNGDGDISDLAGGSAVNTVGGVFMAIRVA